MISPHAFNALSGLQRTDGKRQDDVSLIPWEIGKQMECEVTIVDALSPSRLDQG